ncbi:alanyl-tRNA synthetase [Nematocida sp. AWRm80]|nr:alanyl-tRNA synthetase [Nematocida sp. AWRm80]
MWTAEKLRTEFIEYFKKQKHTHWESSSVLPEDNTLLFTNSGMVQFKKKFLDLSDSSSAYGQLTRACNSQKCIRAGGKHNDLDDVGKDTYHHTFFEMLGNWSFGDYFKKEAIQMAWEFLTEVLKLDKNRLYVSYFKGDETINLPEDTEAKDIWRKYVPEERILGYGPKENFWEMGNSGPCGPCSEIHYDRIGNRDASHLVNMDDPEVIEIWNIVFIQYNKDEMGNLATLPKKHIDTGMGLERVLSILQGEKSNYNTDLFQPIFKQIEEELQIQPYTGKLDSKIDISYRVIADHSRTLAIALMDNIMPSSDGRGYVIRRILRRALGFQYRHLKKTTGLLPKLIEREFNYFKEIYPTKTKLSTILEVIRQEEAQFTRTLTKGLSIITEMIESLKKAKKTTLSGEDAFILYDRFGFPIDLTAAVSEQEGISVDEEGFKKAQLHAKELSKKTTGTSAQVSLSVHDLSKLEEVTENTPTDDSSKYSLDPQVSKVIAIKIDSDLIKTNNLSEYHDIQECGLVLEKTSFYSEAGGQEDDHGIIYLYQIEEEQIQRVSFSQNRQTQDQSCFIVKDTKRYGKYVLHIGELVGTLRPIGCTSVNKERRERLMHAHTATHILNYVLLKVLPPTVTEVRQVGSLVSEDKLRFDFFWPDPLTLQQLQKIEEEIDSIIQQELPVNIKYLPYTEAMNIIGLRHMKGEEYPETVRVVSVGAKENTPDSFSTSIELCGGCHVTNTKEIQKLRIIHESSVARGVRRLTALTSINALAAEKNATELLSQTFSTAADIQLATEQLAQNDYPLLITAKIKTKIEQTQAQLIKQRKKHFEEELQTLRRLLQEQEKIFFVCTPEPSTPPAMINRLVSPLMQEIDASKKEGIIIYHTPKSTLIYAVAPNAAERIRKALSFDSTLKIGGKDKKAIGSSSDTSGNLLQALQEILK